VPTHAELAQYRRSAIHGQGWPAPQPYKVGAFLGAYALAVAANAACIIVLPPLIIFTYPITGILLSRHIGRRIVWWNINANIENVATAKLHFVASWPASMPAFIWKIFVARYL
jgi:hypothetical protein